MSSFYFSTQQQQQKYFYNPINNADANICCNWLMGRCCMYGVASFILFFNWLAFFFVMQIFAQQDLVCNSQYCNDYFLLLLYSYITLQHAKKLDIKIQMVGPISHSFVYRQCFGYK
eukprot:TRINITY_DN6546_c0_g1_i1.p4 TRINITY_DN6546_c0_g1~~TRINITY_DN6546_c0_g1_i1.p4  ORF type:complete len:116 (-),score=3.42 TRINITY_DN6546_c0_g1_i1:467-814(-)